ncbi:MAG: hypothetical protein AAGI34_09790 [Pseudomonadota bacterium]
MPIAVTAIQPRRFRAGLGFTDTPRLFEDDELKPEQLEAIKADPLLMIDQVEEPDDESEGSADAPAPEPAAAARLQQITTAIVALGGGSLTADGKPRLDKLRSAAGLADITREEADAAHQMVRNDISAAAGEAAALPSTD